MKPNDENDPPTLFEPAQPSPDPISHLPVERWSDPLPNVTDLPGSLKGTGGSHNAHLVELLQALLDRGHDPANLADELWSQLPAPPLAERDWRAIRDWLDVAVRLAPTYKDLEDLRRATRLVLADRWRVAHWFESHRRTVEAEQAELEAREAGTYWRDRDARRTATRPLHIDVDDETWSAFKRDVANRGDTLGAAIGRLVTEAVDQRQLPENLTKGAGRRGQGGGGRRPSRFARAVIDDAVWKEFRRLACDADASVASAVGALVLRPSATGDAVTHPPDPPAGTGPRLASTHEASEAC